MAAEIKEELGFDAELIKGVGGVFEVLADGAPVFSKKSLGRFPDDHEVINILHKRFAPK